MKAENRSRSYAANAFLLPHLARTNLVVREGAVVTKIKLSSGGASSEDGEDGGNGDGDVAATAVEYLQDGAGEAVSVPLAEGGRVVVTAGASVFLLT